MCKMYALPEKECVVWFDIPKMDAQVVAVTKWTTIPVEGGLALKDPLDRKVYVLLRSQFTRAMAVLQLSVFASLTLSPLSMDLVSSAR